MTRIIIEIDDKVESSTTFQPTGSLGALPRELLARTSAVDTIDAGSAPSNGIASAVAAFDAAAMDAGASRAHATANEHDEDTKPKSKQK
jgi:hypothetical protein